MQLYVFLKNSANFPSCEFWLFILFFLVDNFQLHLLGSSKEFRPSYNLRVDPKDFDLATLALSWL